MKTSMPWQIYALVILASLFLTLLEIPVWGILTALGVFVMAIIIWDKTRVAGKQSAALPVTGKFEVTKNADGREDLSLMLRNTSAKAVSLPQLAIRLAYTTFAGGTPARGGNGVDSISLLDRASLPAMLGAGQSIRLSINSKKAPVSPHPKPVSQHRKEDETAYATRITRLNAAYALVCEKISAAPSLTGYLEQNPEAFVIARFEGERATWTYSHPKAKQP